MSELIKIKDILIAGRLREVDEDHAQAIAASMRNADGQQQDIVVRKTPAGKQKWTLVDGAHRIRARQILGLDDVEAKIKKLNKDEARLAEIDTGLMRHELTALDRAVFLSERKAIYERLYPETKQGGDRKSEAAKNQNAEDRVLIFTEDAAERIGLSKRSVEEAVMIANRLSPDMRNALQGRPEAKNQSALLKLARLEDDQRVMAINLFKEDVPLADAMVQATGGRAKKPSFHAQKYQALMAAWATAPETARKAFVAQMSDEVSELMEAE